MDKTLTFGDLLRRYRETARLTQEEVAERAGLTPQAISLLERGERRKPQRYTVRKLAETLHLSPQDRAEFEAKARLASVAQAAASPPRYTLPIPPTTLIGRSREVADVADILRGTSVRLVTLTGPGGVGKTRLALQVAQELIHGYADGVYFVALAPIEDPSLVASAIAHELGLTETGGRPLIEDLKAYLQEKQALLVLDNFEQVLEAAPLVTQMLAACAHLTVLVTSRAALGVRGEREYPVSPLPAPGSKQPATVRAVAEFESVRLFIERARDAKPGLELTEENATAVAEICRRLDGLPLALELAAARVKLLPLRALAERLSKSLQLLTGGPRDLPARQQTLRATIDWSYRLLDQQTRTLFRRLAVFSGGCSLDAAEAVCGGGDLNLNVLDCLGSLVENSLLRQEEDFDGEPRFTMLETVREYALERLEESGETPTLRRQHAEYYLELAQLAEPHLRREEQGASLERLEKEHDNMRAVLRWALDYDVPDIGLPLAGSLRWFWTFRSHVNEGYDWAWRMLERSPADQPTAARGKALWTAGVMAWLRQDPVARTLLEESVAAWRVVGEDRGLGYALQHLGLVVSSQGDHSLARLLEEESLALFKVAGDRPGIALATLCLGVVMMRLHDVETSQVLLQESAQLSRDTGDRWTLALALENLGRLAETRGDYAEGCSLLAQCVELWQETGTKHEIARVLNELGRWAHERGDFRRAALVFGAVEALSEDIGATHEIANHAPCIDTLRSALGDDRFAMQWQEGRTMPLDQVVASLRRP